MRCGRGLWGRAGGVLGEGMQPAWLAVGWEYGTLDSTQAPSSSRHSLHLCLLTSPSPSRPCQGAGGRSGRPQKEPCCVETRGGVEAYAAAAAQILAPGGAFVVCAGLNGQPARLGGGVGRVEAAAAAAGLAVTRSLTVVTRDGKPPLFGVYVMRHLPHAPLHRQEDTLVMRYADGAHSEAWRAACETMGLPPLPAGSS